MKVVVKRYWYVNSLLSRFIQISLEYFSPTLIFIRVTFEISF